MKMFGLYGLRATSVTAPAFDHLHYYFPSQVIRMLQNFPLIIRYAFLDFLCHSA